ncbi:MAG: hypothetical protein WCH01_09150 [Methylococcaceae bacterium]
MVFVWQAMPTGFSVCSERRSPSDFARRVGIVGKQLFYDGAMETGDTTVGSTRLASWTNSAGLGL